jgi:hypothetical protein
VPWAAQGHAGYTGYAWYRKRIKVSPATAPLGLLIPASVGAYEVFWNGQVIGGSGRLPPDARWFSYGKAAVYSFPPGTEREGVLCLRFWTPLASTSIDGETVGLRSSPQLGDPATLQGLIEAARYRGRYRNLPDIVAASLMLLAGLLSFALFLRQSSRRTYLGLTLLLVCNAVYTFLGLMDRTLYYGPELGLLQIFSAGINLGLWLVLLQIFGLDRRKEWRIATDAVAVIYLIAQLADASTQFRWQFAGAGMIRTDLIAIAVYGVLETYPIFLVIFGFARRRTWSTAVLGVCAIVYGSYIPLLDLASLISLKAAQGIVAWHLQVGEFPFTFLSLLNWLLVATLMFVVFRLWTRESLRQAQLEQEIRSAQEIQHVLIPEAPVSIPGLDVASVYKPAAEVGGDFFQVIPPPAEHPDTPTLIVVGDVSGKGLKAAMMVSLIVGTLRTLADITRNPAEILAGLNRRLLGRMQGGFVTCVVLRIAVDGSATLANAGHLPPFRSGREWEMPSSLPLGLAADAEYEEVSACLQEGENVMLITDGVLEAQSNKGELYGFERVSKLMRERPSAEQVAQAACSFGQEDDITVVSITWSPKRNAA